MTKKLILFSIAFLTAFFSFEAVRREFKKRISETLQVNSWLDKTFVDLALTSEQKSCLDLLENFRLEENFLKRVADRLNVKFEVPKAEPSEKYLKLKSELAEILGLPVETLTNTLAEHGFFKNLPEPKFDNIKNIKSLAELKDFLKPWSRNDAPIFKRDEGEIMSYLENLKILFGNLSRNHQPNNLYYLADLASQLRAKLGDCLRGVQ
ncbi:MAG: hypothetical protein NZT61_06740 [Deltaproteobacteria bacterium]|nr:hypothetical protein [Deltaproteobacteria bacterium]MCX7952679.1 hypothetical protein [Deltaproteobacteria bacterium]